MTTEPQEPEAQPPDQEAPERSEQRSPLERWRDAPPEARESVLCMLYQEYLRVTRSGHIAVMRHNALREQLSTTEPRDTEIAIGATAGAYASVRSAQLEAAALDAAHQVLVDQAQPQDSGDEGLSFAALVSRIAYAKEIVSRWEQRYERRIEVLRDRLREEQDPYTRGVLLARQTVYTTVLTELMGACSRGQMPRPPEEDAELRRDEEQRS